MSDGIRDWRNIRIMKMPSEKEQKAQEDLNRMVKSLNQKSLSRVGEVFYVDRSEYDQDEFLYLSELQERYIPSTNFTEGNETLTLLRTLSASMIFKTLYEFEEAYEILFNSMNILDRYYENTKEKFSIFTMLVAFWVAFKYETEGPRNFGLKNLIDMTDATKEEIFKKEIELLQGVDNRVSSPPPTYFWYRYSREEVSEEETHEDIEKVINVSFYLIHASTMSSKLVTVLPSVIAAASVNLARRILKLKEIQFENQSEIESVIQNISRNLIIVEEIVKSKLELQKPTELNNIYIIFAGSEYSNASELVSEYLKNEFQL